MKNLATGHTRSKLIFSANRFIFVSTRQIQFFIYCRQNTDFSSYCIWNIDKLLFIFYNLCICNYSYPLFFQNNIYESKRRRKFWVKRQVTDSANIEQWLLARQKVTGRVCFSIPFFDLTYRNIFGRDLQLGMCIRFHQVWYQGIVKATVSGVPGDLTFKISEGSDQN